MNTATVNLAPFEFYTVTTRHGLRFSVMARDEEHARSKVHASTAAWRGFEPLAPANENGRKR